MNTGLAAMVLAAGRGTRLAPWTEALPKPLLPLFDVPLIDVAIRRAVAAGADPVVVNLHHCAGPLEAHLDRLEDGLRAGGWPGTLVRSREALLLGTGGGIAQAGPRVADRTLLVMNCDVLFEADLGGLLELHAGHGAEATVLLHSGEGWEHLRTTRVGPGGQVEAIERAGGVDPDLGVFAGVYVLSPSFRRRLRPVPSCVVREGLVPALRDGARVMGLKANFPWYDLGTWPAVHRACMDLLRLRGTERCGGPGGLLDLSPGEFVPGTGSGAGARSPAYVGPGVDRGAGSRVLGGAVVGAGSRLGEGALVEDAVLLPGSRAEGDVRGAVLGPGWRVGIQGVAHPA